MKNAKNLLEKFQKLGLNKEIEESNNLAAKKVFKDFEDSLSSAISDLIRLVRVANLDKSISKSLEDWYENNIQGISHSVDEGMHYNTRMRQLESTIHPRKVKLAVREAKKMIECMMDSNHPSPNPVSEDDVELLKDSKEKMDDVVEALSKVRVAKRKRKNEEDDEQDYFDDEKEAAAEEIPEDRQTDIHFTQKISAVRSKISDIEAKVKKLQDKKKGESDDKKYDSLASQIDKLHAEADKHRAEIKKLSAEKKKAK